MRTTFLFFLLILACSNEPPQQPLPTGAEKETFQTDSVVPVDTLSEHFTEKPEVGELETRLINAGLVDVRSVDPGIQVDLKYSSNDNFLGQDVYGDLNNAYLQPDVATKLGMAQRYLKSQDSSLSLLVYDGVRPRSVQQKMWDIVDMPMEQKVKFVSNPKNGSLHNFGAAVDLTIADTNGVPLDMGAGFDDPRPEAWPVKEKEMLDQGRITRQHIKNRQLLRLVMGKAGFFNIQSEWWHFNSCSRDEAYEKYTIVE